MRLIDVEVAEKNWWQELRTNYADDYGKGFQAGLLAVIRQPTIEAETVKHGRWVDNGIPESMLSKCSVCDYSCGAYSFNYCPNCGAKMDGGADHD